jgi:hypothetical protein
MSSSNRRSAVVAALAAVAMILAFAPSSANASVAATKNPFVFPSANSSVIGSVGFIDDDEVGYFWSASRGDSVTQTFTGPASVNGIILKASVITNVLNSGAEVDWTISINGIDVGRFRVVEGFTGTLTTHAAFASIAGPNYTVKIRVVNEVPGGEGSHTLAYAGSLVHGFLLRPG